MRIYGEIIKVLWIFFHLSRLPKDLRINIVVPYYNIRLEWFYDAIYSLLKQSIPLNIIVVDDNSPNRINLPYFQRIKMNDNNIYIVRHLKNRGLSAARNTGSYLIRHDCFIAFMDPDDKIHPKTIESLWIKLHITSRNSFHLKFTYTTVMHVKEDGHGTISIEKALFDSERIQKVNFLTSFAMMYNDSYRILGRMHKIQYEDWEFWKRAIRKGLKGVHSDGILYYRRHLNGLSSSSPGINPSICHRLIKKSPFLSRKKMKKMNIYNKKIRRDGVLVVVPWLDVGGAELFDYHIFKNFKNLIILTELNDNNHLLDLFESITYEIWSLPALLCGAQNVQYSLKRLVKYLCFNKGIGTVYVRNSKVGYQIIKFLKLIKYDFKSIDMQHIATDTDKLSWEYSSLKYQRFLDIRLFSNSVIMKKNLKLLLKGGKDTIVKVLLPPLDLNLWKPNEENFHLERASRKDINVFFVGRLVEQKNPLKWLEEFEKFIKSDKFKQYRIKGIVIGSGYYHDKMIYSATALGITHSLKFYGFLSQEQLAQEYQEAGINILLVTSINEGIPLTILEALSSGVIVICPKMKSLIELATLLDNPKRLVILENPNLLSLDEEKLFFQERKEILKLRDDMKRLFSLDRFDQKVKSIFGRTKC